MIKCPNCGGLNPDGVTICGACAVNLEMAARTANMQNGNVPTEQPAIINDFVLINEYIGKNSFQLNKPGFSFCTLFFGGFYLWYRKMYILLGIWLLVAFISWLFYLLTGSYAVVGTMAVIANVYFAIRFKTFYQSHVKKKVEQIKNQNPGATQSDLEVICKRKGRTTVIPAALGVVAIAVPTFFIGKYIYNSAYANYHKLKKEEFIETAHRAITNVRSDITVKSVHVYSALIYDRGDITNISDMRINQSPYGVPYKELKVKVRNTISGLVYSVCMIDTKGNGFGYTTESQLNTSIVHIKDAPSSCE